jgi:signal transduction histidine kinase
MNYDGAIHIKAAAVNGKCIDVAIMDTGPGIPQERWDEIFEFDAGRGSNLGFGLWWINMYVQRFGGTIRLESTPGVGSTFIVRLPKADGHLEP